MSRCNLITKPVMVQTTGTYSKRGGWDSQSRDFTGQAEPMLHHPHNERRSIAGIRRPDALNRYTRVDVLLASSCRRVRVSYLGIRLQTGIL